jgi:hypothetical protein
MGLGDTLEIDSCMGSIAKRLALRVTALAGRNGRSAAETMTFAVLINNFQFTLDAQWAMVANDDFHCGHSTLQVIREIRPTTSKHS